MGKYKEGHEIGEVDAAALKMLHPHLTQSAMESYVLCYFITLSYRRISLATLLDWLRKRGLVSRR